MPKASNDDELVISYLWEEGRPALPTEAYLLLHYSANLSNLRDTSYMPKLRHAKLTGRKAVLGELVFL